MKFLAILLLAALTAELVVAAPGKLSRSKRQDDPVGDEEWASSGWGSDDDDDYEEGSGGSPWYEDEEAEVNDEEYQDTRPEKVEDGRVPGGEGSAFNVSQGMAGMMPFNMSGMPGMMPFNMSGMPGMMPFNMSGMPGMMPFNIQECMTSGNAF
nr:uncharacterized protein LOC113803153 [Penaeus vannamei]